MTVASREPLVIRGAIVAAADALLHTAAAFGFHMSADQLIALSGAVNTLSILAVVAWTRGAVTPVDVADPAPSADPVPAMVEAPAPAPAPEVVAPVAPQAPAAP